MLAIRDNAVRHVPPPSTTHKHQVADPCQTLEFSLWGKSVKYEKKMECLEYVQKTYTDMHGIWVLCVTDAVRMPCSFVSMQVTCFKVNTGPCAMSSVTCCDVGFYPVRCDML